MLTTAENIGRTVASECLQEARRIVRRLVTGGGCQFLSYQHRIMRPYIGLGQPGGGGSLKPLASNWNTYRLQSIMI